MDLHGVFVAGVPSVAPRTVAERAAARLTAAGHATDADDLRFLLSAMGLWPSDDVNAGALQPQPSWDCSSGLNRPRR